MTVSEGGIELVAREGDVIFLRSYDEVMMSCNGEDGNAYYFVSFWYDESVDLMIDTLVREAGVTSVFKDIYEAHRSSYKLSGFKTYTLFMRLLYSLSSKTLKADKDYSDTYHIRSAAEYINLNYDKKISIDELCRVSGYSPAHLRRLFVKYYGVSPRDYILDRRISASKEMLLDMPRKTVEEITEALGICSPSYFCKLFKEKVGITPLEYRERFSR
jgi:AraC-like DNA-binding protein